jgi:hypothetical protein
MQVEGRGVMCDIFAAIGSNNRGAVTEAAATAHISPRLGLPSR